MYYTYSVQELAQMIEHWIHTPPNGYLGQDYGCNIQEILLRPLSQQNADFILSELKRHIPPLQYLNSSQLSIYQETLQNDTVKYFLVLNNEVEIELA